MRILWLLPLAAALPTLAQAAEPARGQILLDARLRYEAVSQDGLAKDAQALTLRTRLGYETAAVHGVKLLVEGENVTALDGRYNSQVNGKTAYPVVADPETTQLNRLQLSWTGLLGDGATGGATVGRQRLILDNARFIGNVGFRQTEQTFDAITLVYRPSPRLSLTYAYLDKVHRILGDGHAQGSWRSDSHIVQIAAKTPIGQVSASAYLLDFANAPAQSSATYDIRLTGSRPVSPDLSITYEAQYARQSDYGNSPTGFTLDYLALGAGLKSKVSAVTLGVERLDGDGRRGFQTPLATLHAFQGWADVFLTTPANGVRDLALTASTNVTHSKAHPVKLQAALHRFDTADGDAKLGDEMNLAISAPLTPKLSVELAAAAFNGDQPAFRDRTKLWLTLAYKL
jgi:hypothetical protein